MHRSRARVPGAAAVVQVPALRPNALAAGMRRAVFGFAVGLVTGLTQSWLRHWWSSGWDDLVVEQYDR